MSEEVVIRLDGGWKRYGTSLGRELARLFRSRRGTNGSPDDGDGPWALRDVSFEVRRGEILGVIGGNGAGKSTLLKVLAGVSPLTHGSYELRGRMFSMIELNAGIHNDLTGRQNVFLLGAFMGLSRSEMRRRMGQIEEFCELGEFFDRPVWTYSSGMLARLGFAVAVNVSAEILLVDEVLAVGDLPFQRKCFAQMNALHRAGKTVVFVSHALRMVERLCSRTLYLNRGRIAGYGPTADVISRYQLDTSVELLHRKSTHEGLAREIADATSAEDPVRITAIELRDASGEAKSAFSTGEPMTIELHYESDLDVPSPNVGIGISQETVFISGFSNELHNAHWRLACGRGTLRCRIPRLMLLSGVYNLSVKVRAGDGSTLGGVSSGAYFAVSTPAEIRRSHEYGYVMTDVLWSEN
jgi:ABC-type polysaccharide/polyol phosphate transport system ATPase subunit